MITKKDLIKALSKFDDNLEIIIDVNIDKTDDTMYNCAVSKQVVLSKNEDGENCIKLFCSGEIEADEDEEEDEDDVDDEDDAEDLDIDDE